MWRGEGEPAAAPMLGPGSRHATPGVPTSGRAAGAAPPAQAAGVVAAAAYRQGDVFASAAVSTAERAGSATAAAAATTTAGFQAALRGALPGGADPPVAVGGGDVASATPRQDL